MIDMLRHVSAWAQTHLRREEGATAVEYGIMVALIAAVIITVVAAIGGQLNTAFQKVSNALGAT